MIRCGESLIVHFLLLQDPHFPKKKLFTSQRTQEYRVSFSTSGTDFGFGASSEKQSWKMYSADTTIMAICYQTGFLRKGTR